MRLRIQSWLLSQPRSRKVGLLLGADAVLISTALWLTVLVRDVTFLNFNQALGSFGALTLLTISVFERQGLYKVVTRYLSLQTLTVVGGGVLLSALILWAMMLTTNWLPVSVSFVVIYGLVLMALIAGSRIILRSLLKEKRHAIGLPVAIYGAGNSGCHLLHSLQQKNHYAVVAFLDDDASLHSRLVQGIQVIDPKADGWKEHLTAKGVQEVFLCIPKATRAEKRKVMELLKETSFAVRTIPSIDQILSGQAPLEELRNIEIEDLLGRDSVPANKALLGSSICGKTVLVTGAAGSIGSELCRQIIQLGAKRLVLFDHSEYGLYTLENSLTRQFERSTGKHTIVALLGSVNDKARLDIVFKTYEIDTVYHAAAYKHVPIVEHNCSEGVKTNVVGTWNVADCARRFGVSRFILISTDKAVRPTNVMGASKRLAEMILQAMDEDAATVFCMVRFGNVLGSSGSVVPLFREQIREGGPITVTHPEITRFFMTIPEAVQLVIQAGSMGRGGDVFVLDMGEPVRIADMARQMVRLSGRDVRDADNPDGDIEIVFTGLRPGEKLYEELLIGSNVLGTEHPKIMRALEAMLPLSVVESRLRDIQAAIDAGDIALLRSLLVESVEGYQPTEGIADHVWRETGPRRSADSQCTLQPQ